MKDANLEQEEEDVAAPAPAPAPAPADTATAPQLPPSIATLRVAELKEQLAWRGQSQSGKKDELALRLQKTYYQQYKSTTLAAVKAVIDSASCLYLPGGNPYRLLDALREGGTRTKARFILFFVSVVARRQF